MNKIHLRIGSALDNQLLIEESGIDPYHLELFSDSDGNVFITDLNTKNGTYVNGKELEGFTLLNLGDKVVLGQHHLFRWEPYILKTTQPETKSSNQNQEPVQIADPNKNKKLNKELVAIYSLIVIVLVLMGYVLD